jgi:hypothetical protein
MDVAHHQQHVEVEIRSLVPAVSESTDAAAFLNRGSFASETSLSPLECRGTIHGFFAFMVVQPKRHPV